MRQSCLSNRLSGVGGNIATCLPENIKIRFSILENSKKKNTKNFVRHSAFGTLRNLKHLVSFEGKREIEGIE